MARFEDLQISERLFVQRYPFHRYSTSNRSFATLPLQKPLAYCTVALVTTAGLSLPQQPAFDTTIRMGDTSFREISGDIAPDLLEMHHRSGAFDQSGILRDRNLALPLDRLREMVARNEIAAVAPHHYSFMGSISGPKRLITETAPEVARRLVNDHVDIVLLTPV